MVRVQADRDICIGTGMCVVAAQEVFDQDDDGLVVLASEDVPVAEEKHVREAVSLCPSGALTLTDEGS